LPYGRCPIRALTQRQEQISALAKHLLDHAASSETGFAFVRYQPHAYRLTANRTTTLSERKEYQMEQEVRELMVEQLKDTFSAEKQAMRCMQKAVRKATNPMLRDGIQMHIEQTQVQIERVEQIMESMKIRPGRKVCEAMRGLVEEAQHEIEEHDKGPVLDLVIVAGMQRIEHYEIAAYGTNIAIARALGEQEAVGLLSETLEEEKQTDLKLTEVTEQHIMAAALGGSSGQSGSQARSKS
jgi:ferritin-like metal-binding protein YciE